MKDKVLIVEDEEKIRRVIRDYLEVANIQVFEAEEGLKALDIIATEDINLVILDVMLEGMDGWEICEKIRKTSKDIIIVMLTAKAQEYDKLQGYTLGADDYVTKPFSIKVLQLKIRTLLSRGKRNTHGEDVQSRVINELVTIDLKSRCVLLRNEDIRATSREFELLMYLFENKNVALSRDKIICNVWGVDFDGSDRTVDTTIKRLQSKVEKSLPIMAVRGYGYRLEV